MDREELVQLTTALLEGVERLVPFEPEPERDGATAREDRDSILLSLRTKVLPELAADGDLPLFIGVQGGTNVGKSTVFNALAGHILSPSMIQASATKHPLVFAHDSWRETFLSGSLFRGLDCRELTDPKELIVEPEAIKLLYFRFHQDDSLRDRAFIDSPDFDGSLESNRTVAHVVTALSDVIVFVTTSQKYRDRDLVEELRRLLRVKSDVVLVFNLLDEDIVFRTLLDDLRSVVELPKDHFLALRVPRVAGAHPEDEVRRHLEGAISEYLDGLDRSEVKPTLIRRTLARSLERLASLSAAYGKELSVKKRFVKHARTKIAEAESEYRESFQLALPEETQAIRRVLRVTELWTYLRSQRVEQVSKPLEAVGRGLERVSDLGRRLLLRFTKSDQESVDPSQGTLADYARARDDTDFDEVQRRGLELKQELDAFFRENERSSPLARRALRDFFHSENSRAFLPALREIYDAEIASRRESAECINEKAERWLAENPLKRRGLAVGAIVLKVLLGYGFASLLGGGFFSVLSWLLFAVGYFVGSYLVAFAVSSFLERRKEFRDARAESLRASLERSLSKPLASLLSDAVSESELQKLAQSAKALEQRLEPEASQA